MTSVRSASSSWFVPLLASSFLLTLNSGFHAPSAQAATQRAGAAQRPALAYTPYAVWRGGGIVDRLRLTPGAIYLIDRSGGAGKVIGDPREYYAYDTKVSPTGALLAFHGRVNSEDWTGEGVGVFDRNGQIMTFVQGGKTFAWSPRGAWLAITKGETDERGRLDRRGLILWNTEFGSQRSFEALPSRVGWAGEDSLLLQLEHRVDVIHPRSGARSRTGHHGTVVSPDGQYSIWPGEKGRNTRVVEDEIDLDVTGRLFGPLERQGLREIRSAFWVSVGDAGHLMCVSGSDHLYAGDPRCVTAIIDADTGDTIASFPGEALGPTGDGKGTVVLHHKTDRVEIVNVEKIVRRWARSGKFY